ncbi:hypothetical protein RD055328_12770 [Companilactobacillus sp. RD055328]|uniref:helix-turn-helix domain-containing protein n=1 Tax=Companilactobacillus sp. RD055328 TaxID=2916634 RepID=UPI001FC87511|nr:helix-turn-helix domain-containing protein [Companilactobacillus sp. RD055328]GKQ43354.1 hypothetical protein RD055328_12770 [Companilactobacillus sp. RD055328]
MNSFLEKDDSIRLEIIKFLSQSVDQWVNGEELAEMTNFSTKKITSLIKTINEDLKNVYDNEYVIKSTSGRGYCLEEIPDTWKKLEIFYYERSLSFLFIKEILFNSELTIVGFCIDNYISIATLNRKIQRILPILNTFDLKININKGRLIGSELRVRQFYFELLKNVYGNYQWPMENISQKNIEHRVEDLNQAINANVNFIDRYLMEIYVCIFRYSNAAA